MWNPVAEFGNWTLILALESVQRRFTRLIDKIGTLPYSQRLDIIYLTTLAERRNRGNLIEAYKAVNGNSSIRNLFNIGRSGINLDSDIRLVKEALKFSIYLGTFERIESYIFGISFLMMLNYHVLLIVLK